MTLKEALGRLINEGELPFADVPSTVRAELETYGLAVVDAKFVLADCELLERERFFSDLSENTQQWVQRSEAVPVIGSTNSALLDRARTTDINGHILCAEAQSAGRGRRGRSWVSPFAQNIAVSLGIKLDVAPSQIGAISLGVGLAVALAVEEQGIQSAELKWPNDVLIQGRKVGGILIELVEATRPVTLVIGIGVNVLSFPGIDVTGDYMATALNQHISGCSRNRLLAAIVNQVLAISETFEKHGIESLKSRWEERDMLKGLMVELKGSEPAVVGTGLGIDSDGAYRIKTEAGNHRAIGGDLSLRRFTE